jgi:hypothetical protein
MALNDLPAGLDETYDRIFKSIPCEEQEFVFRTVSLLCGHDLFIEHQMIIEVDFLASLITKKWESPELRSNDQLCNEDTLRDICGCLITVSKVSWAENSSTSLPDRTSVTLAHYTVREFLVSKRLKENLDFYLRSFALTEAMAKMTYSTSILATGLAFIPRGQLNAENTNDNRFRFFLLFCANQVVQNPFTDVLDVGKSSLQELVYRFINPCGGPITDLILATNESGYRIQTSACFDSGSPFGPGSMLHFQASTNQDAAFLVQLFVFDKINLASKFLIGKELLPLLQAKITAIFATNVTMSSGKRCCPWFQGNTLELLRIICTIWPIMEESLARLNSLLKDGPSLCLDDIDSSWDEPISDLDADRLMPDLDDLTKVPLLLSSSRTLPRRNDKLRLRPPPPPPRLPLREGAAAAAAEEEKKKEEEEG